MPVIIPFQNVGIELVAAIVVNVALRATRPVSVAERRRSTFWGWELFTNSPPRSACDSLLPHYYTAIALISRLF